MKRRVLEDLVKQRDYAERVVNEIKNKYKSEISGVEHLITFEEPVHWETPDTMCLLPNQFILGASSIEDISTTSKVFNKNGYLTEVSQVSHRDDKKEYISIKPCGTNIPINVTPEHRLLVLRGVKRKLLQKYNSLTKKNEYINTEINLMDSYETWITASELTTDDYLASPIIPDEEDVKWISLEFSKFMRHNTRIPKSFELSDNLLTTLGLWVAEGSGCKDRVAFSFSSKERDLANFVIGELDGRLNLHHSESLRHDDHVLDICFHCAPLVRWLNKTFVGGARTKSIPNWILTLPKDRLALFLRGIWLGDGFKSYNGPKKNDVIGINIASRDLAYQIQAILLKLGVKSTVRYYQSYSDKTFGKDIYQIKVYDDSGKACEILGLPYDIKPRKQLTKKRFFHNNKLWSKVEEMNNHIYNGIVYDLTIPNENSYTVNNFIVHNSEDFNLLQKARKLGYKTWVLADIRLSHEGRVVINTSGSIRVPSA